MKKQFAITALLTLVALLSHINTFGQTVVTGTALNVSANSSNTVGASSSGAAIGKNNTVSSILSDKDEDATIILVPTDLDCNVSSIRLWDSSHGITVNTNGRIKKLI